MSKEFIYRISEIELDEVSIFACLKCGYFHGHVVERINGPVPVLCQCELIANKQSHGNQPSPSMHSPDGKIIFWNPCTNHFNSNHQSVHTPHFMLEPRIIKINNV